jgi:DNA-binding MarR family transcriptional regulator
MSDLAAQLGLTSGGTTRLVDRVVAAGLVGREACPSDRRVQWVVLSDDGERKLDEALTIHLQDLQHELVDRLDPAELEVLERALDKLRACGESTG